MADQLLDGNVRLVMQLRQPLILDILLAVRQAVECKHNARNVARPNQSALHALAFYKDLLYNCERQYFTLLYLAPTRRREIHMIWLFALIVVVMVTLIILTVEILIPRAIVMLGNIDSWWSPVRTLPLPGEMYVIVRGDPSGPFHNVIASVLDFRYDKNLRLFVHDQNPPPETYLRKLGIAWVGFQRYRLWREVRYDKWEMVIDSAGKPTGKWGLVPKLRGIKGEIGHSPSIFFRYNMATKVEGAETVGNFPVDAIIVFTVQIMNPAKALFLAGGWESQITASVQGKFRKYVSDKRIEELRTEQKAGTETLVATEIKALGGRRPYSRPLDGDDPSGLYALFGIEVIDARFVLFDLLTGDEDIRNAIRALEIATLNAAAAAKKGEGERDRDLNRSVGRKALVDAHSGHPVGAMVALTEVLPNTNLTVLGGNVIASVEGTKKSNAE